MDMVAQGHQVEEIEEEEEILEVKNNGLLW
jgi:hypothetical protein